MRGIAIILLIVLLVGCEGFVDVSDTEYVNRAEDYLSKGELKSATIELKNALSQNPKNPMARWLLGKLHLEMGNGPGAEKELNRARELGVVDQSVLPFLAKALLAQDKNKEVLELGTGTGLQKEGAAEFLTARGLAYLSLGDTEAAASALKKALQNNPRSTYALTAKASLMASRKDLTAAYGYLAKALAIDKDYPHAWSYQGDLNRYEKKYQDAIEAYSKAIKGRFSNTADLQKRALLYVQTKQYEQAQKDLDLLKKRVPRSSVVQYAQGLLHLQQNDIVGAQAAFALALSANSDFLQAMYFLGVTYYLQGNMVQASEKVAAFVARVPGFVPARRLLALIRLQENDPEKAETLVRPVVNESSEDVLAMNILADALLKQGKSEEAIDLLQRVSELKPDSAEAKMNLGVGLLQGGDRESGLQEFSNAINIDPQSQQADLMLILGYLQGKNIDKAQQAAEAFTKRQPDSAIAYSMVGLTLLAKKDVEAAEKAFQKAREISPGDPLACSNLASIALSRSNIDGAKGYYGETLEKHKGNLQTLLQLAALEERLGNRGAMRARLKEAMDANPEALQPILLMARDYLREGKRERARGMIAEASAENRNSPAVLHLLGEIQLSANEYLDAKLTFQQLIVFQPDSADAHYRLAQAYRGLNEKENFKKELEQSLQLSPEHLPAKIELTWLLLGNGDLESAATHLASLKESQPDHPEVLAIEAKILAGSEDSERAFSAYQKLFESNPSTATLVVLTGFQWRMGDKDGSVAQLEQWIDKHKIDQRARLELANSYLGLKRNEDAMNQYRKVLELSEDNLVALNNLAWYLKDSDPGQALVYAENANRMAPESTTAMDTLAMILLAEDELERSQRLIDRALELEPGNPTLLYHRALVLHQGGKEKQAIAVLGALLSKPEQFSERTAAEQMLKRIGGS